MERAAKKQRTRRQPSLKRWRLKLVIEPVENLRKDSEFDGYDLTNSKPWPLGDYKTERDAIYARNRMVVPEQGPETEAIRRGGDKPRAGTLRVG
jgi:hypothetical protein